MSESCFSQCVLIAKFNEREHLLTISIENSHPGLSHVPALYTPGRSVPRKCCDLIVVLYRNAFFVGSYMEIVPELSGSKWNYSEAFRTGRKYSELSGRRWPPSKLTVPLSSK